MSALRKFYIIACAVLAIFVTINPEMVNAGERYGRIYPQEKHSRHHDYSQHRGHEVKRRYYDRFSSRYHDHFYYHDNHYRYYDRPARIIIWGFTLR